MAETDVAGRVHDLKSWPDQWMAINSGHKTADLRNNDLGFEVGDVCVFREWDPDMHLVDVGPEGPYTGRECRRVVTHVLHGGRFGLNQGYVMLSLAPVIELLRPEWCVFYGGPDPENVAGRMVYADPAEAEEMVQWVRSAGLACRGLYATPWTVVQEPTVEGGQS